MKDEMVRVLITNAYSSRNRGDGAIVLGMMTSLGRSFGEEAVSFEISSADHPADRSSYSVPVVPSFHSLMARISGRGAVQGLWFLGVLLPLSILGALVTRLVHHVPPLPAGLRPLLQAHARADLVVTAGGGYLYTTSPRRGAVMLLVHLHGFMLARLLGKPVYLYAQSIGPFASALHARLVRTALRRVRMVELREDWSLRLVKSWNLPVPVHRVADAAFLLEPAEPRPDPLPPRLCDIRLRLTVRRWFREADRQERYEEAVADFLREFAARHDVEAIFLPQVTVATLHDDDRETARRILHRLGNDVDAHLLDADPSPPQLKWLCGRMDCLVGTRMHSNIFALSMGVPVAAIAYQPKTAGIMEQLGLADFVLPMEELDDDALLELVERVLSRQDHIRETLARRLPVIREEALRAGRLIAGEFLGNGTLRSGEDGP